MTSTSASLSLNLSTGHSNSTTKPQNSEFCPPWPNAAFEFLGSSVPYIVNAALNVPLAITTTLANLLVLLAMRRVTSIRLPSKLLIYSLVLTDLGAGVVIQPQFIAILFMRAFNQYRVNCFLVKSCIFTMSSFGCVSLFTMAAISLDRYTALFHYLEYQQIVTARRVSAVLTFIWSACALFLAPTSLWNKVLWDVSTFTSPIFCFLVISVSYIKIYRRLRGLHGHQVQSAQAHDQAEQQAGNTLNMAKYKSSASAMMWVCVLFVLCYLPFCVASVLKEIIGRTALTQCIWDFSATIILLNSCLNPFVYCLRLPEIRTEVMKQLRKFCWRSPEQ